MVSRGASELSLDHSLSTLLHRMYDAISSLGKVYLPRIPEAIRMEEDSPSETPMLNVVCALNGHICCLWVHANALFSLQRPCTIVATHK